MIGKKLSTAMIAAGLVAGSIAVAIPAYADNYGTMPAGCSMSPVAPTVVSGSQVHWSGSGYCASAAAMDTELVHNYDGLPDYKVADRVDYVGPSFSGSGSQCDNGGSTQYYTQLAYYNGDPYAGAAVVVQRVSATKTLSHC